MTKKIKISLKSNLIIIFIISIIVAILCTSVIVVKEIMDNSKKRTLEGDKWLLSQLSADAGYISSQAENLSATLAFDGDIQSALIGYQYGVNPGLDQVRIKINNNLLYKSKFNMTIYECPNIVLFSNEGKVVGSKETFNQNINMSQYEWYPLVKDSNGKSVWLPLSFDKNSTATSSTLTIPIVRKIFSTQSRGENTIDEIMTVGKALGYITVYVNVDMFSDLVAQDLNDHTKRFFLLDENNRIISCRDKSKIGTFFKYNTSKDGYTQYDNRSYLMSEDKVDNQGWTYICLTDKSEVTREANMVITVCMIVGAILIIVFSAVGILISKIIGIPIATLNQSFKIAEDGQIEISKHSSIIEFERLYEAFNQTMNKIHILVNEVYENKLAHQELVTEIKESQIRALQMQINPHFLYNTLDCINWQAQMDGNKQVSEMICTLGKFFRSNTDKNDLVTLKEEIENIRLYIYLSKLRFGSRLHCLIDIKESLYSFQVIKLLLQPLVENAIKHGLEAENKEENIWLWCGEEDDDLVISVKDDGSGIDEDKLQEIKQLWLNMSEGYVKTDSIGIYNVMRRLYLYYKTSCNFEIFSQKGKGTEVIITFPKRTNMK